MCSSILFLTLNSLQLAPSRPRTSRAAPPEAHSAQGQSTKGESLHSFILFSTERNGDAIDDACRVFEAVLDGISMR